MIERDGFTRDFPWMTSIKWRNDWANEDSTRRHRHRCQSDPGIGDRVRPTNLDMIPQEKSIPSRVLRFVRELCKQPRVCKGTKLGSVECVFHESRIVNVLICRKQPAETFIAHAVDKLHQLDHCLKPFAEIENNNFTAFRIFRLEKQLHQDATTPYFSECRNIRLSSLPRTSAHGRREADGITVADNLGTSHLENSTCTLRDTNRRR